MEARLRHLQPRNGPATNIARASPCAFKLEKVEATCQHLPGGQILTSSVGTVLQRWNKRNAMPLSKVLQEDRRHRQDTSATTAMMFHLCPPWILLPGEVSPEFQEHHRVLGLQSLHQFHDTSFVSLQSPRTSTCFGNTFSSPDTFTSHYTWNCHNPSDTAEDPKSYPSPRQESDADIWSTLRWWMGW